MKAQVFAVLTEAVGKISSMGTKYHEVTILEHPEPGPEGYEVTPIEWKKIYYPNVINHDHLMSMINKKVLVDLNFYVISRKSGDKYYQDVKVNIENVALIPAKEVKK